MDLRQVWNGCMVGLKCYTSSLNARYDHALKWHLLKVYSVYQVSLVMAAIGAYLQVNKSLEMGVFSALGSLLSVFILNFYRPNGKNTLQRLLLGIMFAFCSGQSIGPLMTNILDVNPRIVYLAAYGVVLMFVFLSLAALLAQEGRFLYVGSMLIGAINVMALTSLINFFLQSSTLQFYQLYLGVFIMAAFVVYDTQHIIDRCRNGNYDVVQHALDLFFDTLSMFRRIVIILAQKENRDIAKTSMSEQGTFFKY